MTSADYIFQLEAVVGDSVSFSYRNESVPKLVVNRAHWIDLGRPVEVEVRVNVRHSPGAGALSR